MYFDFPTLRKACQQVYNPFPSAERCLGIDFSATSDRDYLPEQTCLWIVLGVVGSSPTLMVIFSRMDLGQPDNLRR